MRAFVYETWPDNGKDILGSGRVTNEYKSVENLIRYGVKAKPGKKYRVYLFYNWDNRYGKEDCILEVKGD